MVLNSMHVHKIRDQKAVGAKMSLFLDLSIVPLCMSINKNKNILVLGEVSTQGLDTIQ